MTSLNLQPFWTAQKASGINATIFTSELKALAQVKLWEKEVELAFVKWENGERVADGLISSRLESTPEGGCVQTYSINPAARPSVVTCHPANSENPHKWDDCPGFESVRWGNPATARP